VTEKKAGYEFETGLFLPESRERQGEGGLRTQGYFKDSLEGKTLITIVTVVYNGAESLEETILSVINQTYDNIEYIIIDGGSTDATLGIIRKYEHAIDYWVSEKDSGIYDAMNKGIDLAKGEWINFMNGGDCFFTESVLNDVFFDSFFEDTDILYGKHQVRYSSGRKRDAQTGDIKNLWKGSQFCHQASFTRANYHKLFKFNLCTKIVADFEFFYDAWKNKATFKAIPLTVVSFEAGGISDIKRIDTILGWWQIVDKSFTVNKYYLFSLVKELVKDLIKKK
jgi:glycosyltransferase involved in cell wall biosynthesis